MFLKCQTEGGRVAERVLLLSGGGLDSCMAAQHLIALGIELHCVHFDSGFVPAVRSRTLSDGPWESLGVASLTTIDIREDYRQMLQAPTGGPADSPCFECKIGMLKRAAGIADQRGIHWLATGDVVGQRRADQTRQQLNRIDQRAEVSGRVCRPLALHSLPCAAPIFESLPVVEIHGTSRRVQLTWADQTAGGPWPTPHAGCCRLADRRFRLLARDLMTHGTSVSAAAPTAAELESLSLGRHFRLNWNAKAIASRNAAEADRLAELFPDAVRAELSDGAGPRIWLLGKVTDDTYARLAALLLHLGRRAPGTVESVRISDPAGGLLIEAQAAKSEQVAFWRL